MNDAQVTRQRLQSARRWVIKIGSSLLTNDGRGLDHAFINALSADMAALLGQNHELVLVSSGSIAEGINRLGWRTRPSAVHELQAAAAVGQMGLVQAWESGFKQHGHTTAQILLTHDDISNRRRYLNARSTLLALITHGVVPIVNENDTVITDEIRLGDNDTLGAMVANLISAEVLVLLTDQQGLYDHDPRSHPEARLMERANASDPEILALAGPSGTTLGSGGMRTKVLAADRAAQSGCTSVIAYGREARVLERLAQGEPIGTMLTSEQAPQDARTRWLSNQLRPQGVLLLDEGACLRLREHGSSLLAVGVVGCTGDFRRGEVVDLIAASDGRAIGRGLVNYGAVETLRIQGVSSDRIVEVLGYSGEPELVHRDNMVVFR